MERIHAWVSGRVQGVCFRAATQEVANRLELVGWVRNLRDGRVELTAEGTPEKLEALLTFLQTGPPYASVDKVDVQRLPSRGDLGSDFFVARTA